MAEQDATNLYKRALKKHITKSDSGSLVVTDLDKTGQKAPKSTKKIIRKTEQKEDDEPNPYKAALKRHLSPGADGALNITKIEYDPLVSNILIIGGNSGIGLEIVKQINNKLQSYKKWRLYVTGYPDQTLSVQSNKIIYRCIDLTQSDYINVFTSWLFRGHKVPNLDLVIYCAGIGYVGDFIQETKQNIQNMIQINYTAPVKLTHLFYPYLLKGAFPSTLSLWNGIKIADKNIAGTKQKGKMVYLGSPSILYPTPDYMVYSATKAALQQFAVNLRYEYNRFGQDNGIDISIIHPPPTKTEFHKSCGYKGDTSNFWKPYDTAERILDCIFYDDSYIKLWIYNIGVVYIGFLFVILSILYRLFEGLFDIIFRIKYRNKVNKYKRKILKQHEFKHLIITGGSKGLGLSLTHFFANNPAESWNIVNISRNESKFSTESIQFDLAKNEYDSDKIINNEQVIKDCDVLINNAALNVSRRFHDLNMNEIDEMIQLNLVVPILMVHDTLKRFRNKKIVYVFIASLSNYVYYPYSSVYGSTKIGITDFAKSLGIELFSKDKYNGSDVLIVCPGPINTEMARQNSPNPKERAKLWWDPNIVGQLIYQRIQSRYLCEHNRCKCIYYIYEFLFNRVMIIGWKEYCFSWLACVFPMLCLPIMTYVFRKK